MFEHTVRHFTCGKSAPLYGKHPNASSLRSSHEVSPIVSHIPNDALSCADSLSGLPYGAKCCRFHVFQRNHQCSPFDQRLEAKLGFQAFQCIMLPSSKSSALDELIELLIGFSSSIFKWTAESLCQCISILTPLLWMTHLSLFLFRVTLFTSTVCTRVACS